MAWECESCGWSNADDKLYRCEHCRTSRNYNEQVISDKTHAKMVSSNVVSQQIELSSNRIATTFKIIAVLIFIGGFILGIVLGEEQYGSYSFQTQFSILLALPYWVSGFISGMVFLGFAEVIKLLQTLVNQNRRTE